VVVILGLTVGTYLHARRQAHAALRDELRVRARTLAGILEVEGERIEFEISPRSVPDFEEEGSGTFAAIVNHAGKLVVRSPSLGDAGLPIATPWREGEFVFDEIDRGPYGIPCAAVTYSFVARAEGRDPPDDEHAYVVPATPEDEDEAAPPAPPEAELRFRIRVALDRRPRDRGLARLALFLSLAARGRAMLNGRGYVIPQDVKDALNLMIHVGDPYAAEYMSGLAIVRSYYLKRTPDDLFEDVYDLVEEHDDQFAFPPLDRMDWVDAREVFFEQLKEAITED